MTVFLSDPPVAAVPVRDVDQPVAALDPGCGSGKALAPGGMRRTAPSARTATHRSHRILAIGLMAVVAVITTGCVSQRPKSSASPSSPSSSAASPPPVLRRDHRGAPGEPPGGFGEADGVVPDGVTVFDDGVAAVAKLDPDLLKALRRAATDAADDNVTIYVNSGWRSAGYQNQLLREAVSKYGSEDEAARWVSTAATSAHVSGDAVDLGHSDATAWLAKHGAAYGLCQIYRNEAWHYELRPAAIDDGCPSMYADPTQDPRMQQ